MSSDWAVLQLDPTDDLLALKVARHRAMKKAHPDLGGTSEAATLVEQAYDRLVALVSTPKKCQPCRGKGKTLYSGSSLVQICKFCSGSGAVKFKPTGD